MSRALPVLTIASGPPQIQAPPGRHNTLTHDLGIHADIASPREQAARLAEALYRKFALQNIARSLLPQWRVYKCLRIPHSELVDVFHNPEFHTASYSGLQTCGSPHVCPICGAKIGAGRAEDIAKAITTWTDQGGGVLFVTFTLQHELEDSLADIAGPLNEGFRRLKAGKRWVLFEQEYGVIGSITAREYTFGNHGWHPHLHTLFFVRGGMKPRDIWKAQEWLKKRWGEEMVRFGRFASHQYGVKAEKPKDPRWLAEYVSKGGKTWTIGDEMARANSKKGRAGRTPAQLLESYAAGDEQAGERFKEYAAWTWRKNALVWSRGLRARLGLAVEKSDEELAAARTEGENLLASLTSKQWTRVLSEGIRAEVLLVAAVGDAEDLQEFLFGFGVDLEPWQVAGARQALSSEV